MKMQFAAACALTLFMHAQVTDPAILSRPVQDLRKALIQARDIPQQEFSAAIALLAQGRLEARNGDLLAFSTTLHGALKNLPLDGQVATNLASDIDTVLDPRGGSARQTRGAATDFAAQGKKGGISPDVADRLASLLRQLAPPQDTAKDVDPPLHPFVFDVSSAPRYDRSVLVEDFEAEGDFLARWYQPPWSSGIQAIFDPERKFTGKRGATISNTQPAGKGSGTAKVTEPSLDIRGMNAIRFWLQPSGQPKGPGTLTVGFLDGTREIWQMDVPDIFSGDKPVIVQLRLADYRRTLRRNNGVIDPQCQTFALWMSGSYQFTIDDIRFVHSPDIADLPNR